MQAQAAKNDSVVGKQAMEVIGGLASTVCVLKSEQLIEEMVEEGDEQSWHSAVDICPQVKLPDIDSEFPHFHTSIHVGECWYMRTGQECWYMRTGQAACHGQ